MPDTDANGDTAIRSAFGIIGWPIAHSISPRFQQAALDALGIAAEYRPYAVPPDADAVAAFVAGLRAPGVVGINVTVPHKEAVIPHLDEIDEWAAAAGAVNTIVHRDGRLTGHNTDGYGFLRALREEGAFDPAGKRALILGAGGAARGVVQALLHAGIGSLHIANRTRARAETLAQLAAARGIPATPLPLSPDAFSSELVSDSALAAAAAASALIVNCTSLGMTHGPAAAASPLPPSGIPATALVYDLVYNPLQTPLLRAAQAAGAPTLGGIAMLVYQGAAAFELWHQHPAPVAAMLAAATAAMSELATSELATAANEPHQEVSGR